MENTELTHWGIKGMKWGVRRFQNKDGSLTKAGRKRYGSEESSLSLEEQKQKVLATRSASAVYRNAHLFSDKELNDAYNRLGLETRILELDRKNKELRKGEEFSSKMVEKETKITEIVDASSKMYNSVAKVLNSFVFKDTNLPLIDINSDAKDQKLKNKLQDAQAKLKRAEDKVKEREQQLQNQAARNRQRNNQDNRSENSDNNSNDSQNANNSNRNESNQNTSNRQQRNIEPITENDFERYSNSWENLRVSDVENSATAAAGQSFVVHLLEDD